MSPTNLPLHLMQMAEKAQSKALQKQKTKNSNFRQTHLQKPALPLPAGTQNKLQTNPANPTKKKSSSQKI